MRTVFVALVVVTAGPAFAEPCAVDIVRAPDDVREVVETWVRAEPRCTTALEVRILPTDGGLYLLARDASGRVHERVVPDAQSAGVLIASWAADDSVAPPVSPAPPVIAPRVSVAPSLVFSPPAFTAAQERELAPPMRRGSSFEVGPVLGVDTLGVRLELDAFRAGNFTFGLAASLAKSTLNLDNGVVVEPLDGRLIGYAAYTMQRGRFSLRASVGVGVLATSASYDTGGGAMPLDSVVSPVSDVSVRLGVELAPRWTLGFGPVWSLYDEHWPQPISCGYLCFGDDLVHRVGDVVLYAGIRRQL